MSYLNELLSPSRVLAIAGTVFIALIGLAYWFHQRWVANVDTDIRGKAGKGEVERMGAELAALEQRFIGVAQDAAVSTHDVIALREAIAKLVQEVTDLREQVHRLEYQHAAIAALEGSVQRMDRQLDEVQRKLWGRGE